MKRLITLLTVASATLTMTAQSVTADDVLNVTRKANNYFMAKYADPTIPTNVKKVRPSSLWTRAVYYEGLMALYEIDKDQRYIDYTDRWANFHQWTPRNGIKSCDADDQCCAQTYLIRYEQTKDEKMITKVRENLDYQMQTPNDKKNATAKTKGTQPSLYGWWTWIDAIQMAMPVYMQMYRLTGETKYRDHGMAMYRWSRNECGGGLFNVKDGLWWRDADYVPPYKEPDGKDCYWSRGNGWVYAALVRCMNEPRQRLGVCRLGALHERAAQEVEGVQGTEEGLPTDVGRPAEVSARRRILEPLAGILKLCNARDQRHSTLPLRYGVGHTAGLPEGESLPSGLRPCLGGYGEDCRPPRRIPRLDAGHGQGPFCRTAPVIRQSARLRGLRHRLFPLRSRRVL